MNEPLKLDLLHAALHDTAVGHTIHYHQRVLSTMPVMQALAADPAVTSGTLVIAEEQTAGRGRRARRWETPPGTALLVSLLLKAPLPMAPAQVPMAAGLALIEACVAWQPALAGQIGLKWPNDLLVGQDRASGNKVAGILVESSYRGSAIEHLVVGMGLNVLQTAAELPPTPPGAPAPTSLRHFLETQTAPSLILPLDRTALLIALCQAWAELLTPTAQPHISERWRTALWTLGQSVTVHGAADSTVIHGVAVDVEADGHLIVADHNGQHHTFAAGDVSLRSAG